MRPCHLWSVLSKVGGSVIRPGSMSVIARFFNRIEPIRSTSTSRRLISKTAHILVQDFSQKNRSVPPKIQKTKDRIFSCLVDLWF
jgi:hypothetical protein